MPSDRKNEVTTERTCHWCSRTVTGVCRDCQTELANRADPKTMTAEDRIAETRWFLEGPGQYCEVPFDEIHGRLEALIGRPVWTHEFANPACLMAETECRFLGTNCDWSGPNGDDMILVVVGGKKP